MSRTGAHLARAPKNFRWPARAEYVEAGCVDGQDL
jgi:hypothetical protein